MAKKKQKKITAVESESESFTVKQQRFIMAYEGNGTLAAKVAGYSGNVNTLGVTAYHLLRNPKIVEAIKARSDQTIMPMVADRAQRQVFWTQIMSDDCEDLNTRLKASELLGKSEGDFITKIEHDLSKTTLEMLVTGSAEKKDDE